MPTIEKFKGAITDGTIDPVLLAEVVRDYEELKLRADRMEELLIMIVRTGWPWDEEGEPNAIYNMCKEGFAAAMTEAKQMLALGRSRLTRTEPKT